MKKIALSLFFFYLMAFAQAQTKPLTSSEILHGIEKLNTVGNVMYVAAHPDDENTLLISWLSKEKKMRTAYIALTRGDGGQNLIGTEQGEFVGLLRTHELLEARKIDGGEQYFSRAIDFGFTKTTDEALKTWGKNQILSDLVYQIRKFKPDVIINRFPPDERAGHGHHSASAVLSAEAFDAAADPKMFPEQLSTVGVWQAKRVVWNAYNRGFTNGEPSEGSFVKLSLGDYNPLLGKSYPEIAAEARSKHRSQGFGSAPSRNERYDFAVHIKGTPAKTDLFDDIDLTWNRVKGGEKINLALSKIIENFKVTSPSTSVKDLVAVYEMISNLEDNPYKVNKKEECVNLIMACSALYLEANPSTYFVSPGERLKIFSLATSRSSIPTKLKSLAVSGVVKFDTIFNADLENNKSFEQAFNILIPLNAPISQPYWIQGEPQKGIYKISDEKLRGLPMAPDPLQAEFTFEIYGKNIIYKAPIKYKYTEPSFGEIYKYLEIRPEISLNIDQKVYVFADNLPKSINVKVFSNKPNVKAAVSLNLPKTWKVSPTSQDIEIKEKGSEKTLTFIVTPSMENSEIEIKAFATTTNGTFNRSIKTVKYEHIPELNTFPMATAKANHINLLKKGKNIGYIAGAGDEVPDALKQIGYDVTMINEGNIKGNLQKYDAIIVGVRAYNTEDWLVNTQSFLHDYVFKGGNLIVQYQTQAFFGTVKTKDLGPYPLAVGRGRVTDENAKVEFIKPASSILNTPNKITEKDFEGWVQERGLYFADKWSDKYETIFRMKDEGETDLDGSLLYTKYGKGNFVFTGLSFFRQLPAGVPGAYRLMSNLISMGK